MYDLTGVECAGRGQPAEHRRADQPVPRQPDAAADRGHDRPRGHAPDRLQLRPARAVERLPHVVQRGHRHVLRDARPAQRQRLGGIGVVNRTRLAQFRQYLQQRPADSLQDAHQRRPAFSRPEAGRRRLRRGLGPDLLPHPQAPQAVRRLLADAFARRSRWSWTPRRAIARIRRAVRPA